MDFLGKTAPSFWGLSNMCFDACETWDDARARARRFILFLHFRSSRQPQNSKCNWSPLVAHREFVLNYINGDFRKFLLVDDEALDIMGKGDKMNHTIEWSYMEDAECQARPRFEEKRNFCWIP